MKKYFILAFLFQALSLVQAQKTIFVNINALGGTKDGTSWTNAFDNIKTALNSASVSDQIWVAKGTYYPTTSTDRTISFVLRNGVQLYGGFNGTEVDLHQRDFVINETVLSGNIGGSAEDDNSYHVLYGSGLDSTTVLDGFVVTQGVANSTDLPYSNGWGGGLLLESSQSFPNTCPKIQNCRFEQNFARAGGAIYCLYDQVNKINPILRNCQFISNRAVTFAGAVYKKGAAMPDEPFVIENCLFARNAALTSEGGGVFLANMGHTTIFRNCIFESDSAKASWAGGLYCAGVDNNLNEIHLIIDSCVFTDNYASEGAGFCYTDFAGSNLLFKCDILDSIFEGNKTSTSDGAAFLLQGFQKSRIVANISRSSFIGNLTINDGITSISAWANSEITATYENCIFLHNQNSQSPAINTFQILNGIGSNSLSNVSINNSLFAHNGGGIAILNHTESLSTTTLTNCTFYHNGRFVIDKNWSNVYVATDTVGHDFYIQNCIFWEPQSNKLQLFTNNDFNNVNMYDYHIDNSLISLTDYIIPGAPEAYGNQIIFGQDPKFIDPLTENFRLQTCSPAVNKGNNMASESAGLVLDLQGYPRIFLDTVDLGAFEVQDSCGTVSSDEQSNRNTSLLTPNPAVCGGVLHVNISDSYSQWVEWQMLDMNMHLIAQGKKLPLPTGTIEFNAPHHPGIYILHLRGAHLNQQLKFVVVR